MSQEKLHKIPTRDPVSGGKLFVSELTGADSGIQIRGKFEIPIFAHLDNDQAEFLEAFLRCRGMISCVEKELGISYPTVRARLDALLTALNLTPAKEDGKSAKLAEKRKLILDQLERGEITAQEAKAKLREKE
ncbi:MAG TPA: DUF2089 domain-containing protein [Fimbriimonadaceae bacterium]|jgi:hypothetical protein